MCLWYFLEAVKGTAYLQVMHTGSQTLSSSSRTGFSRLLPSIREEKGET